MALAHVLAEDRAPPTAIWTEDLVSSRLLEYEVWTRIHAQDLSRSHGDIVRAVLARLHWVELSPPVLARAVHPFPVAVRTLDALHLATMAFLMERGHEPRLATYDARLGKAAAGMGMPLAEV